MPAFEAAPSAPGDAPRHASRALVPGRLVLDPALGEPVHPHRVAGLVQFSCSTAEVMIAPAGTWPAPLPMSVGNFIRPCACGVWPSTLIDAPPPLGVVGVSAVICASSTCAGPLKTAVCGGPPTYSVALASPAGAVAVALKVTAELFDTPWSAGDAGVTAGAAGLRLGRTQLEIEADVGARRRLLMDLDGDRRWCRRRAATGRSAPRCHALSSAPPMAVVASVVY